MRELGRPLKPWVEDYPIDYAEHWAFVVCTPLCKRKITMDIHWKIYNEIDAPVHDQTDNLLSKSALKGLLEEII